MGESTTFGNYVLGLAGLALVREWYTDNAAQHRNRLIELATSYGSDDVLRFAFSTPERELRDGYTIWAETYDGPGNPMTQAEEAEVTPRLVDHFSPGMVALDAGCGTGRHCRSLADIGYGVIGTDLTPAMLEVARDKVPEADFRQGPFEDLPIDDDAVDLITSALAVCHAADLDAVFREFARVLRPGGRVIVSDPHPTSGLLGGQAFFRDDDVAGAMPFVRNHAHPLSDYATALISHGFRIDGLTELPYDSQVIELNPTHAAYPELTTDGLLDLPFVVIWDATLAP